jgi:hypothetical protein
LGTAGVGGGGGSFDATASGSISAGDVVGFNSNGTVSTLESTGLSATAFSYFDTGSLTGEQQAAVSYNERYKRVVIAYRDSTNSNYLTIINGTVNGSSISWGSPVVATTSGAADYISMVYRPDSAEHFIVCRIGSNLHGVTYSMNSSGTGSIIDEHSLKSSINPTDIRTAWHPKSNKLFVFCKKNQNNRPLLLKFEAPLTFYTTSSGSYLTDDGQLELESQVPDALDLIYDPSSDSVVFTYAVSNTLFVSAIESNPRRPLDIFQLGNKCKVSASGDTVTDAALSYDYKTKSIVVIYTTSSTVKANVVKVDVMPLMIKSMSPLITLDSGLSSITSLSSVASPKTGQTYTSYIASGSTFKSKLLSVNGSTSVISQDKSTTFSGAANDSVKPAYDPFENKFIHALANQSASDRATYIIASVDTPTIEISKCVGVAAENISSGSTGEITISGGLNSNMSGLTAGSVYYISKNGSLSTTDSGGVEIGRAVSSSSMLVNVKSEVSNTIVKQASSNIYKGQPVYLDPSDKVGAMHLDATITNLSLTGNYTTRKALVYDSKNDVFVHVYTNSGSQTTIRVRLLSIAADKTVSLGSEYTFSVDSSAQYRTLGVVYDPHSGLCVLMYRNTSTNLELRTFNAATGAFGSPIQPSQTMHTSSYTDMLVDKKYGEQWYEDETTLYLYYKKNGTSQDVIRDMFTINSSGNGNLTRKGANNSGYSMSTDWDWIDVTSAGRMHLACYSKGQGYQFLNAQIFRLEASGQSQPFNFGSQNESTSTGGSTSSAYARPGNKLTSVPMGSDQWMVFWWYENRVYMRPIKVPTNQDGEEMGDMARHVFYGPIQQLNVKCHGDFGIRWVSYKNNIVLTVPDNSYRSHLVSITFDPSNPMNYKITDQITTGMSFGDKAYELVANEKTGDVLHLVNISNNLKAFVFDPFKNNKFIGFADENIAKDSFGKIAVASVARDVPYTPSSGEVAISKTGDVVPVSNVDSPGVVIGSGVECNTVSIRGGNA